MQRAQAAHQQIGLEGPEDRALALADGDDAGPERVLPRGDERAGDDVGMAVQDLRRGMHDDVGAERQRARMHRRGGGRNRRQGGRRRACAISAAAAMSVMVQSGFAGVSIQTSLVSPGRTAASSAAEIVGLDEVDAQAPSARPRWRASCAAPSTSPAARRRGRRGRAPGTPRSPPPCRRRRAAPPAALLEHGEDALGLRAPWRCRAGRRRSPTNRRCPRRG